MKQIAILFLFLGVACSNKLHQEKSEQKRSITDRQMTLVYDSLLKRHKDYKLIVQEFEEGLLSQIENSPYPKEVITLYSGKIVAFATSNNLKVKETINRLPDISPVELLLELRNIEGEIKFQREIIADNWVKREHFSELLALAEVDVKMPIISVLSGLPNGSDCIQEECLLRSSYAKTHITIGYEALHMMKLYLKVGGGYPANIRNDLNLMREWYDSGQPKEEYKKVLDDHLKK